MDAVKSKMREFASSSNMGMLGIILVLLGVVLGLIYGIKSIVSTYNNTSSPGNIKRIREEQVIKLTDQYNVRKSRIAIGKLWGATPEKQRLLINTNLLGCRLAGYLGPFENGVFSADEAIDTALKTGARLFLIEIDALESDPTKPVVLYRDSEGYKRSLNQISVRSIAKAIKDRAFSANSNSVPPALNGYPFVLVLYFHKTPDIIREPKAYIEFLGKVSTDLQILQEHLLADTPQGDFRRQALDRELFYKPMQTYTNKIILLCNVDTSIMRRPFDYGVAQLKPGEDLDNYVNARLYTQEINTSFGATTSVQGTKPAAAVLTTPDYFMKMPDSGRSETINLTKGAFTICMDPDPVKDIKSETLNSLVKDFGVHTVPMVLFKTPEQLAPYIGIGELYETSPILAKPTPLQFVPPDPIVTKQPSKAMDTRGGYIALGAAG